MIESFTHEDISSSTWGKVKEKLEGMLAQYRIVNDGDMPDVARHKLLGRIQLTKDLLAVEAMVERRDEHARHMRKERS